MLRIGRARCAGAKRFGRPVLQSPTTPACSFARQTGASDPTSNFGSSPAAPTESEFSRVQRRRKEAPPAPSGRPLNRAKGRAVQSKAVRMASSSKETAQVSKRSGDNPIRRVQRVHASDITSLDRGWLRSHPFSVAGSRRPGDRPPERHPVTRAFSQPPSPLGNRVPGTLP